MAHIIRPASYEELSSDSYKCGIHPQPHDVKEGNKAKIKKPMIVMGAVNVIERRSSFAQIGVLLPHHDNAL